MRIWAGLAVLVIVAAFAFTVSHLLPPRHVVMAAGPSGGAYEQIAQRYKEILQRDGLELELVETAGSAENMTLLENREADVALLQGGIRTDDSGIEAIASIFFEPMILLVRTDSVIPANPRHWQDLRINSGAEGSGTAAAFRDFQIAIGLPGNANTVLHLPYDQAIEKLANGEIDVAAFVAPLTAPYLTQAYMNGNIRFLRLEYVQAIARRIGYAKVVTIPAGAISLNRVVPEVPRQLLALEARLAIVPDLHPALVNRLTMAAIELHGDQSLIADQHRFPSVSGTGLPVNNTARQLVLEGPSTWHDWLPYWLAAQINRVLILLLPIFFILLPLLQALPRAFSYLMGWRVWQHYPAIREIEVALDEDAAPGDLERMDRDLAEIDERLSLLRLPAAYRSGAYNARLHVELVRQRIRARMAPEAGG